MTQTVTIRDELTPLRDWLRAHAGFDTDPVDQIYVGGIKSDLTGTSIAIARVGGFDDGAFDRPLIQFDVRHPTSAVAVSTLVSELKSLLVSTPASTALAAKVHLMGARVESDVWSPDQPGDTPRRVLTVEITVKHLP